MRSTILILSLLVLAPHFVAHAKPSNDAAAVEARKLYDRGMAHFNLREFDKAITVFEEAYRIKPDPVFLYNLAQAHRLLEHHERALYFYRAYLRTSGDAPNRDEVEGRIATLEQVLASHREAAKPPDTPLEPKTASAVAAPAVTASVVATPAPPRRTPVYKQWWLWTIVGVAAVGLGVGLGVGLTASNSGTPQYPTVRFP